MTKSNCSAGALDGNDNIKPGYEDDFADYLANCRILKDENWRAYTASMRNYFLYSLEKFQTCFVPTAVYAKMLNFVYLFGF